MNAKKAITVELLQECIDSVTYIDDFGDRYIQYDELLLAIEYLTDCPDASDGPEFIGWAERVTAQFPTMEIIDKRPQMSIGNEPEES